MIYQGQLRIHVLLHLPKFQWVTVRINRTFVQIIFHLAVSFIFMIYRNCHICLTISNIKSFFAFCPVWFWNWKLLVSSEMCTKIACLITYIIKSLPVLVCSAELDGQSASLWMILIDWNLLWTKILRRSTAVLYFSSSQNHWNELEFNQQWVIFNTLLFLQLSFWSAGPKLLQCNRHWPTQYQRTVIEDLFRKDNDPSMLTNFLALF